MKILVVIVNGQKEVVQVKSRRTLKEIYNSRNKSVSLEN